MYFLISDPPLKNTRILVITTHLCTVTFGLVYCDLWMKDHGKKVITRGLIWGNMSCMKSFDSTAGLDKEPAVFFLLVWRWVKVENAVSLSLENACTNIRSCGKWYAYYYLLVPPTAECQLPLSFPEPSFYSKEAFVCNKRALTFAWLVFKSKACDIQIN